MLKLNKWHFFHNRINYLGQVISPGSLDVAPKATDANKKLNIPTNITELRSFLGLCNVFSRFVPNVAGISAPLNLKFRKAKPTNFDIIIPNEKAELSTIQKRFVNSHCWHYRSRLWNSQCIEMQSIDRSAVYSSSNKQKERSALSDIGLDTQRQKIEAKTERGFLAVLWALQLLRPYLKWGQLKVRMDHSALKWILNLAYWTGRLDPSSLRLLESTLMF